MGPESFEYGLLKSLIDFVELGGSSWGMVWYFFHMPCTDFLQSLGTYSLKLAKTELSHLLSGLNRIDFPTSRKVDAVDPFG